MSSASSSASRYPPPPSPPLSSLLSRLSSLPSLLSARPSALFIHFTHALAQEVGLKLCKIEGVGDNEASSSSSSSSASSTAPSELSLPSLSSLPPSSSPALYYFSLANDSFKSERYVIKFIEMGDILVIHAMKTDTQGRVQGDIRTCQLNMKDFIDERVYNEEKAKEEGKREVINVIKQGEKAITLLYDALFLPLVPFPPPPPPPSSSPLHPDYDPLRVPHPSRPSNPYGDDDEGGYAAPRFGQGDIDPFSGPPGNLMGPGNFPFFPGGQGGGGLGRGGGPVRPRFDPYGPFPGSQEPDPDELFPPGTRREGEGRRMGGMPGQGLYGEPLFHPPGAGGGGLGPLGPMRGGMAGGRGGMGGMGRGPGFPPQGPGGFGGGFGGFGGGGII